MIRIELADKLRRAGVVWSPAAGDRFIVPDRDMDDEVFVVSDMAIEVHELSDSRIFRLNGTTEWALDSLDSRSVLWLPREEQLRTLLGERFRSLVRSEGAWTVEVSRDDERLCFTDADAESAYALGLLATMAEPVAGSSGRASDDATKGQT